MGTAPVFNFEDPEQHGIRTVAKWKLERPCESIRIFFSKLLDLSRKQPRLIQLHCVKPRFITTCDKTRPSLHNENRKEVSLTEPYEAIKACVGAKPALDYYPI